MSKKPELVPKLLEKVSPRARLPRPLKEGNLLEQGMLVALVRHLSQDKSERVLGELRRTYPDWNELRVAQVQEIASLLATGERRGLRDKIENYFPVARAAREYLQEIFQKNHGFDLEFLREDPGGGAKVFAQMPYLGLAGTCYLLWLASERSVPSHPALVRVLERVGLISKGASGKKGKDVLVGLVPEGRELEFVSVFGEVADRWCHAQKPLCHECPLVEECTFGRKAFQEWKTLQTRLAVQRQREEARRAILEKKEAARRAKEDARAAKKAAADAAKAARERERLARSEARRKEAEAKQKARDAKRALSRRSEAEATRTRSGSGSGSTTRSRSATSKPNRSSKSARPVRPPKSARPKKPGKKK